MNIKGIFIVFLLGLVTFSCQKDPVKKPKKFIEEETMISILYDLSLLEAIKSNNPVILEQHQINPHTYIYKKYKSSSQIEPLIFLFIVPIAVRINLTFDISLDASN